MTPESQAEREEINLAFANWSLEAGHEAASYRATFRALFNRGRLVRDIEIIVDERAADILSASAKEPE